MLRSAAVMLGLALVMVAAAMFVATTEAGARWTLGRVKAASGGALSWRSTEGSLMRGLRLDGLVFDTASGVVTIRRLELAWQPWRLLDGTLVLDRMDLVGLRREARASSDEPFTPAALRDSLFALPVAIDLRAFRANEVEIVDASGGSFVFDSVVGGGLLDSDALVLTGVEWQRDNALVTGELTLASTLALSGTVVWQVQMSDETYAGSLGLDGALPDVSIAHSLTQPLQLVSEGSVATGLFSGAEPRVDLSHAFPAQLLATLGQPELLLQGSATTRGTPVQLEVEATLHAEAPEFAPLDLVIALDYADKALRIDRAVLTSEQIALDGRGRLQLDPLALQLDWMLNSLVASDRLPQLELEGVTGAGSVELRDAGGTIAGALRIDNLAGALNGHPLALAGSMAGDRVAGLTTLELRASSGANTLDINGSAGRDLALQWNLQAPALDTLWQGLAGNLAGSGSISGTPDMPRANGALQGALQLARADGTLRLESLTLSADYGAGGNDVQLTLGALTLDSANNRRVLLQQGELALTGTPAAHAVRGTFSGPEELVQFRIEGAAADGDWRGVVQQLTLDSRGGEWQLEAPFAVDYVAATLSLAENCWTYVDVRACVSGSKPAAQGFSADVAISALPLAWLNPAASAPASKPPGLQALQDAFGFALPENAQLEGEVDAQLSLRNFLAGSWDSLDLVVQPRDVAVEITQLSEDADLAAPVQRFNLMVNGSELHAVGPAWTGSVDLQVMREEGADTISQGSLRGRAMLAEDGTLEGSAEVAFSDMGWIEFALPDVREPKGMLTGTLGLAGTRAQPQLQARMQMRNGQFDVPLYGLDVRNVNLDLETEASGALRLAGSAQSGDGTLSVRADVVNPLQTGRAVTAELSGENILAFATEYARVTVSPQLQGSFADNALAVNGSVDVSDTEIDLEALFGAGRDSVKVSRDVVIVAGAVATDETSVQSLQITADLVVRIGEQVHVRGYDLDAFLGGELTLEQSPGRPLLVYGELDIPEGRYEIYNQELNARDGRLVFFGNPANPMLDVRAFRETASGEVGVLLTGNLDSIQGRLYSTPALPENETLALLVTGKSFNSVNAEESDALVGAIASFGLARGEGLTQRVGSTLGLDTVTVGTGDTFQDSALGLGKYLTPDLLMRYKIGLFDRQSVLGIEYKLSERLKLQVETGISQSVDLNYMIEKE
ncbi:MAG: hypothetical protein RLZZ227_2303 [Pseudomonadota bacterium]